MIPRGPHPDPLDLYADELLDKLHVRPRIGGQIVVRLCARGRLALPPGQRLVVHVDLAQHLEVGGEVLEGLAVVAVAGGDLELVKVVEDVELGEVERGVVVAGVRVLDDDEIEPAAAALAARRDADLVPDLLELLALGVELFGWEGPAADAGRVRFYNADDFAEGAPAEGGAGENAAEAGVGGGYVGVGAVVDVEHEGVCAFDEDGRVVLLGGGEEGDGVDDEGGEFGAVGLRVLVEGTVDIFGGWACAMHGGMRPGSYMHTLYFSISSSTSYFSRSPNRFLYPSASLRIPCSNFSSLKMSHMRSPLRVIFVLYVGPMPFFVVPISPPPSSTSSSPSTN